MNRYFKAISSNYILFFVSTIFFLVITALAIRVMGEDFYGLWVILNSILLFSGVGMLGMGVIVNKFASEVGEDAIPPAKILSAGFAILLPMACLVAVVILLLRKWISVQLGVDASLQHQLEQALVFTAISVIPQFLGRVPHGYLLSQLKNVYAMGVDLGVNIALWTGAVVIAAINPNLVWMAAWGLLVQSAGFIVLWLIVLRMVDFKLRIDRDVLKKMLGFSGFSFLQSLANILFQHFDRILVGFVLGPAAAGVYSVGTSVALRLSIVAGQATDVMLPYASQKSSQQDNTALYHTFRQLTQFVGIVIGVLAALLILWMDLILAIWISPEYAQNYALIFRVIVLAYIFMSICRSGHQTLMGMGKIRATSLIFIATSLLMLTGLYFLASRYGLMGAAASNLLMVFLLLFNLMVYPSLTRSFPILSVVWDHAFALGLPLIAYAVSGATSQSDWLVRLLISVMIMLVSYVFLRRLELVQRYLNMVRNELHVRINK
ncbi:MAG: oligosaccharide flippase family protein [Anaerolineae bacterium]|nr:oligosaccharide flippase family protein [Anaerolineae bacterium]